MTAPVGGATLGSAVVRVVADVRRFARSVRTSVAGAFGGRGPGTVYYSASYAGNQAGDAFGTRFARGVAGGVQAAGRAFTKIFNPAALLAGGKILALVASVKQLLLLGPAIAGLGSVLGAFAASLPALAITAVLVSKTMTLAFQGVGEAIAAAAEGDVAKLNEAIKDLSPSAQSFVREVAAIAPEWKKVGKEVQESFFAPFKGAFSELANPAVLGALRTAMKAIAGSLGEAAAGIAGVIGEAGRSGQLANIFTPLTRAVAVLVKQAPALTEMFLGLADHAAPVIEKLAIALSGKLGTFFEKINALVADGGVQKMFDSAAAFLGAIGAVLYDVGRVLSSVFDGLTVEGESVIETLGAMISALADFLETAEGADALRSIGVALSQIGGIIIGVVLPLLKPLAVLIKILGEGLALAFAHLGPPLQRLAEALGGLLLPVFTALAPVIKDLVSALAGPLGQAIGLIADHITKMTPTALEMVQIFGPLMGQAFTLFGDLLISILPLLQLFADILQDNTWIFKTLAGVLGAVFAIISGLIFVVTLLVQGWTAFATVMKEDVWGAFPEFLDNIGKSAVWVWEGIKSLGSGIASLWDTITNGGETVMSFMGSIPGRISGLAGQFFQSAANLGGAIGRGFQNIGNFASEIGGKIVGTIKSGLNAMVRSINSGIAQIDSVIPGALPRLSFFARGGIIDSPTLGVMGEGGKREVVLPLTDPARTAQLAQQSGLMDILRAGGMGGGAPVVNITAILDGFGVLQVVDQRVDTKMAGQGRELAFGTRGI